MSERGAKEFFWIQEGGKFRHIWWFMRAVWSQWGLSGVGEGWGVRRGGARECVCGCPCGQCDHNWGLSGVQGGLGCEPRAGRGSSFGFEREAGTPHSVIHEGSVVTMGIEWGSGRAGV